MRQAPFLATFLVLAATAAAQVPSPADRQKLDGAQQAYARGQDAMGREAFDEAARNFRTAFTLDPMHWLAWYGLGQAQMALKRFPEAVEAYRSSREVFLRFSTLDLSQQNAMERAREDEIREVRDTLLAVEQGRIKGSGGPINVSLAVQLQDRLRVLEGARMRGKESVVTVPAGLMLGLGSAHFRSGQLPEAQAAFQEAVKIDPKLGPAHNNLAVMHMLNGRFDDAKKEVKLAEKSGTQVPDSLKQEIERRAREARPR